jgi:hypothetical protein
MRGEPGDAMARMKRWDAVRQRLADSSSVSAEHAVDEVVRALSEVVQRHRSITVTVTVDDTANEVTVRIRNGDGQLEVTRIERPIVGEPRPSVGQPRIVSSESRAVTIDPRVAPQQAWSPRPTEPPHTEPPHTELPRTELPRTEPPRTELPRTEPPRTEPLRTEPLRVEPLRVEPLGHGEPFRPADQARQGETMDQTAARLAEMIRRDPSLLDVRQVRDPDDRP